MKKGISIWSFPNQSFYESFKLAKAAGFEGVEVDLSEDGEINLTSTKEEILKIKEDANKAGISLYSVSSGLYWKYSLTDNNITMRDQAKSIVKKQLEVASWLGCDAILVVPGAVYVPFESDFGVTEYDLAFKWSMEALKELAPIAEELKVSIGIENVWNGFLLSPIEMRDFIDEIGSDYVGAYFDVGNVIQNGFPQHWIKILGNRIRKVHFKDYKKSVGTLDGFVDLLAGDVDFPTVMAALKAVGYEDYVTAEMIPPYQYYPEQIIYNTSNSMNKILGR